MSIPWEKHRVNLYKPKKACDGYTLIDPFTANDVWLIDMRGNYVHRWVMPTPPRNHGVLLANGHLLYATQPSIETSNHLLQLQRFFLDENLKLALFFAIFELNQIVYSLLNGAEVGHHATQPALVHVAHAAARCLLLDGLLSLLLGSHKQNILATGNQFPYELIRLIYEYQGLLQINDMNTITLRIYEFPHARIPAPRLMTEMHSGF